tara:strand:- start:79 stop:348 length:270 start_codon:yes stop_codon:yes gene_type:complete
MKPLDQLQIVEYLAKDVEYKLENLLSIIPAKYHTTSLESEARCELSYNTGRRDMLVSFQKLFEHMDAKLTAEGDDMLRDMYEQSLEDTV